MKCYLLSDNIDTKIGMRLAGIDGKVIHDNLDFIKAFDEVICDKNIAILLITQKLAACNHTLIEKQKANCTTPLIIEIPDRHGSNLKNDYILKHIKDAIGITV